jgi:hypothetical protein
MGQQIGEPGGIVDVALAAGNVANVHSVGEDQFHACLKDMPRGFPILARGFHRHVGAAVGGESVAEPARSIREEGHSCALWQGLLGGRRLSLAAYVMETGAPRGATVAGGGYCWLSS